MKNLGITDEKLLDNESMFKTKSGSPVTSDYLRHRLHYVLKKYGFNKHIRDTKSAQILKYNTYIKDTIQNNMKQIESMNNETIKDPVLHDKVVQTMKNTLEKLVEDNPQPY